MRRFGLIGYPLGHSFSKKFFTEKFEKEQIDACYELYPLENIAAFESIIKNVELTGLNVTIPYKQQVIQYLDELDATAAEICAVNVIKFIRNDGQLKLKGYNSDAYGFEESIKPLLNDSHHRKALVLGTGGASKAVEYTLQKLGIETQLVSRSIAAGNITYKDLNRTLMAEYSLVVNCTPAGMFPAVDACPEIPYEHLDNRHLLYDVIYKPEETLFLKKGKAQGATIVNGIEMLFGQARAAWTIWNS